VPLVHQKYDLPEIWYLDLWPFAPHWMVLASPDAATEVVQTRNFPKHPETNVFMEPMVGRDAIPGINGALWKEVYHMLAPAFKPATVRQMVATATDEVALFRELLLPLAESGEEFVLEDRLSRMVFEVAAKGMGLPFDAQRTGSGGMVADIKFPIDNHLAWKMTWDPRIYFPMKRKCYQALGRSSVWFRSKIMERYETISKEDITVPETILDSCLLERVRLEQSGQVKKLMSDPMWMELLITK
jgi:cytochrome P450